jgi:hypothetical protein
MKALAKRVPVTSHTLLLGKNKRKQRTSELQQIKILQQTNVRKIGRI